MTHIPTQLSMDSKEMQLLLFRDKVLNYIMQFVPLNRCLGSYNLHCKLKESSKMVWRVEWPPKMSSH